MNQLAFLECTDCKSVAQKLRSYVYFPMIVWDLT